MTNGYDYQKRFYAEFDLASALVGHMMNAEFALESGTKREAIDILKRGIALAAAARKSGDGTAPSEGPQSGGEAVTPNISISNPTETGE